VDKAPGVVVGELSVFSRMEFHMMPLPHPMSGVFARGIEYDQREALVLHEHKEITLSLSGQKVKGHLMLMKSVKHPEFPTNGSTVEAFPGSAMNSTSGFMMSKAHVTRTKKELISGDGETGLKRATIKVRGLLIFDSPVADGAATIVAFGHEDQESVLDFTGRLAGMVGLGGMHGGATVKQVTHLLTRLCDVAGGVGNMEQSVGVGAFAAPGAY